ncbi:four-carbon acid sugar kinase family protein [Rhizobium leguminosarum]|uniref:Four-carbon acid sugar kinase N-terminal domain-containing protein n=1 Tax=Rhizobium leguminosarum TaxID=384 RepID=A0A6P0B6P2_RHILE|nr:four-carbon acid sugar kinase family protein [Rhizobium leguminosarum]MBY5437879.1 hypothetical protein [Rhizobium leguminosarum]NEI35365.1 hypothetical protein [Rhizobium leguminosarum]NEI42497.1 hypothetical protein [Rhizobium leguminosarum]
MLLGAIADDVTGASDLANTLARGGMSTVQFVGTGRGKTDCEAGVVALKTRSAPVDDAVRQSLEAARWLIERAASLVADRAGPLGLALKSGNFGAPDFFAKALDRIAGHE